MKATVSLNVSIFRMFSRSRTKCSLSAREYFLERGLPRRTRPLSKDCFGVSYSPSMSAEPSESLSDSSSMSASFATEADVAVATLPSPSNSLALASIYSFSSSVLSPDFFSAPDALPIFFSSSYKCFLMNSSISSSDPPSGSK